MIILNIIQTFPSQRGCI